MAPKSKDKKAKQTLLSSSDESSSSSSDDDSTASSSSSSSSKSNDNILMINSKYATQYQTRKEMEELSKKKHLLDDDGDSSSSGESEDSDADLLTDNLDTKILKTLKAIRNKDDTIYESERQFFSRDDDEEEDADDESISKKKKTKPKRYKDVIREQILSQIDNEENKTADNNSDNEDSSSKRGLAYDEEQRNIRSAFLKGADDNDDDIDELLLHKSKQDPKEEDAELVEELKSYKHTTPLPDPRGEIPDGASFLESYIQNRKWMDKTTVETERDSENDEDSLNEVEQTDIFESKYNFRFEEEEHDKTEIISYGRNVPSMRRTPAEEARKVKRQQRLEKKQEERKKKEEQLKRLKNARKKELERRKVMIEEIAGGDLGDDLDVDVLALLEQDDWDESKFEEVMNKVYNEDYYEKEESKDKLEVGDELMEELGVDKVNDEEYQEEEPYYDQEEQQGYEGEEGEYYEEQQDENYQEEEGSQKKDILQSKIQDELYKLDYEDILADGTTTRFKYKQVEANNYGLTSEEILLAKDSTLKQFVSLRKMSTYQTDEYYPRSRKRQRFRDNLKDDVKILKDAHEKEQPSQPDTDKDSSDPATTTNKKRRRQKKKKDSPDDVEDSNPEPMEVEEKEEEKTKKTRKKRGKKVKKKDLTEVPSETPPNDTDLKDSNPSTSAPPVAVASDEVLETKKVKSKKSSKKKKKKSKEEPPLVNISGVSASRLASYGL